MYSNPVVSDQKLFIGDRAGFVYCLDARTGHSIWRERAAANADVNSTFLCSQGRVFVGTNERMLLAFEQATGSLIWRQKLDGPCAHALLSYQDLVVAPAFSLTLHRPETGEQEAIWSWPGESVTTVAIAGDEMLVNLTAGIVKDELPRSRAVWIDSNRAIEEAWPERGFVSLRYDPNRQRIYSSALRGLSIIDPKRREIECQIETQPLNGFGAIPDAAGRLLYVLEQKGRVWALEVPVP